MSQAVPWVYLFRVDQPALVSPRRKIPDRQAGQAGREKNKQKTGNKPFAPSKGGGTKDQETKKEQSRAPWSGRSSHHT